MKKILTLLAAFVLTIGMVTARPVDRSTAKQVAENFYHLLTGSTAEMSIVVTDFTEFYVLTTGGTDFVMVPSDDCTTPIVGYSLTSKFVNDNMPRHMRSWFDGIEESIRIAKTKEQQPAVAANWQAMQTGTMPQPLTATTVSPLIATTWNQAPYYNDLCPVDSSEYAYYNYKLVTGCVATATAQIMKYWEHPTKGYGSHTYNHNTYGIQSANFGNTTYDWDNMPNELSSTSSSTEVNAVATLMYHIGVADEMDYGLASAGGSGAHNYNWNGMLQASSQSSLQSYFKYKPTMYAIGRDDMSADEYDAALMKELDASRPILYSGRSASGGHSFVVDGYDELNYNSTMFHINWGWGGYNDGYFPMGGLEPTASGIGGNSESAYNQQNVALLGIEPNSNWGDNSTVSATVYGSGTVSGTGSYNFGDTVQLMAFADEGYRFDNWGSGSRFNPMQFVANGGDVDVTANFKAINETDTISYCGSGHYLTGLGYGSAGSDVFWGIRIPSSSIASGKALKAVEFYAVGAGNFTVSIYTGASLPSSPVSTTTVAASEAGWVQMTLSSPISVASGSHIWIGISNNEYAYPAAMTYGSGNEDGALWTNSFYYTGWDQYSFMVRGIMGEDNGEPLPGECDTPLTSLNEGFENSLDCWTFIDADGDGFGWEQDSYPIHDYNGLMSLSYDMNGTYEPLLPDNWAVSPAVTISDSNTALIWWAQAMCSDSYAADKYSVYVGTGNDVDNYTQVYTETFTNDLATKRTVYLSDYVGQTIHVAFRHHDCTDMCGVIIDDVSIDVAAPPVDCSKTLTTLNEEFSEEIQCWTLLDEDGDGNGWNHSGSYMQSDSYTNTALTPDNWLISPKVLLPNEDCYLSLDLQTSSGSYYAEHYGIYVSTTGTATSDFTLLFEETCSDYSNWQNMQVDLSAYAGQEVYLAVRHFDCTDQWYLRLDNVKITAGVPPTTYNVSFTNNGGYMVYKNDGDYSGTRLYDGDTLTKTEGYETDIVCYTFNPATYTGYYSYDNNYAELTHFYVDGVEVPLSELSVIDNMDSAISDYYKGYITYTYHLTFDADHTIEAEFGPYSGEMPDSAIVTISGNGGYFYATVGNNYYYSYNYPDGIISAPSFEGKSGNITLYSFSDSYSGYYSSYYDADHAELVSLTVNGVEVNLDSLTSYNYYESYGYKYYYYDFTVDGDLDIVATYGPYSGEPSVPATVTISSNGGYFSATVGNNYYYSYNYPDGIISVDTYMGKSGNLFLYSFAEDYSGYYSSYYDADHAVLKALKVNGEAINIEDYLNYYDTTGYTNYYYPFTIDGDMDIVATYGPFEEVKTTYTVTVNNPDGGYVYYCERDENNNQVQCNRIYAGTTTLDIPVGHRFCVDFGDINPNMQPAVNISKQYAMVSSLTRNGEALALDGTDASVEITDDWDDYGYRLYTVCDYYTSDVTFDVSYSAYDDTEDKENATLTVINNGGGYLAYLSNGSQYRIYDTMYRTMTEGSQFTFTFGTFTPIVDWSNLVDTNAMRLEHLYFDGEELALDTTVTPGLVIYNHNDEGYIFYNYTYTQDTDKHTIEFVYGPYSDSENCDPVAELKVDWATDSEVALSWLPAPSSTGDYTVKVSDGKTFTTSYANITFANLEPETEYTVTITSACLNGDSASASITFTTYGPLDSVTFYTNNSDYLASFMYRESWYGINNNTTWGGYSGETLHIEAASLSAELSNQWGYDPTTRQLDKVYLDGVELPIDGSDDRVKIYTNLNGNIGQTIYSFDVAIGEVHSVQLVYTGDCPAVEVNSIVYDGGNAYIDWYEHSGVTYTFSVNGVEDTNVVHPFTIYGLQSDETYEVVITALCPNGETMDTTLYIHQPEQATLTVINNGGGHLQTLDGSDWLMDETSTYSTYQYTGAEGDYYQFAAFSFPIEYASAAVLNHNANRVKSISYDGVSLPLDGSDDRIALYGLVDNEGNSIPDAVAYVFSATLGEVSTVEVVFGSDDIDSVNCYAVTNLQYDYDAENAYFSWGVPSTSDGNYEVYLDGELYATTKAAWFDFYGLSQNTTYTVTIRANCLNGSYADTTVTFTTKNYAGYTLKNPDGGQVYTPQLGYISDTEPVYVEGYEGDATFVQLLGMTHDYAENNGFDITAYQVESLIVDGTPIALDGSDTNLVIYDFLSEYGEIYYLYHFTMGDVDEIEVHFTGDQPDTANCTTPDNFRIYDLGTDYVEFAWTTPASSNGTFQITLTDSNGNVQQVSDVIICQPMGQTSYHWMYGLDGGVTYTATLTNFCLNGNSADTSITFTTVSYSTVTVTKNQNGLLSNPEWGGQLPVGTNTITGVTGNQSYFMAGSFSTEAATEYGWSLKYRTISEMKVDGVAVDINDYIYDTAYTEGGNMYVRYVYWFYYGDISTFEISYTGDDLPSYDYTLKNNGGYMRFIDYGSSATINFESDTTVTVDSANTVITLFYSYNPNHPDNAGITLGAGHEILSEVYLDGESIPIDGSDSRLVVNNYMSDEGYISYYIQHVAEGPHTIEGVFTEWVEPEKVQFTFTNTGNGPMSYYVDPDDEILVVGTMTDSVEMFSSVTSLFLSIDPSKASDFGLSEEDLAYFDGTKLSAVYLDGESIAIDGSDSRISIVDYSMYGLDGLIFYTLEVDANGPHTIEGVFAPWSDTPSDTNTYTITIKNPDGGYMFVGDDMIEDSVVTYTLAAGKTLTIEMATYDPLYYTSFPFIGAEKLTEVIYDGENIALDGSNPLLTVEYGYTSATLYFMTVTADADHTVEAHYVSGIDSTLTYHDVTLINNGGFMTYIVGNGSQTMVEDTTVLNLPEGTIVTVCASTDAPTGTYYSYPDYTQLNHFYFDGKDIPLDGSDPTMQITDYMGTDGYLWYVYQFEVDADHTAECEFGPWTGDIDTTGESEQRIITFTNTGNGYMAQGDNLIVGTMTFTADSGISFYTTFASVHPNSSLGMTMTAAGFTGHKLSKIKVDGVEVPLVASDMLEIENLMATDSVIAYYLLLNTNTDHTIEGIFTAWDDSTIVNPDTTLYTFNLTNTGNGAMIYDYDDMDEYDIPFVKGSMSIKVPAGNTFIAEFIDIENTDNAEVKELFAELGITASKLDAIKLDGVSVPLVNSTNLIVVDNTVDEDIPEGVTIYALFVEAYSDHTIEGIFNGATPPDTVYYTIEAVSADTTMGTVTGGGTYLAGTTITLKASAKDGFHFVSWQDGDTNSQRTVVVSGNATYIATFSDKEGIDDLQLSHIAIYPNPATTKVTLDGLPTDAIVTIFDLGGRQIELFNTEGEQLSIDLGHYARGTYFVRISSSEGNAVRKLLVR